MSSPHSGLPVLFVGYSNDAGFTAVYSQKSETILGI